METILNGFDFTPLLDILLGAVPALLCITLHEMSHGLVALRLGDTTARDAGRLTLNPLKHLDPLGLLMLIVFHFGWAKPVPVNMYRFRDPKRGMALTALAGPVSNLIIAVVFLFLYGLCTPVFKGAAGSYVLRMMNLTAVISLGYAVFNLLPVPPLDGSKVLLSALSNERYYRLLRYERYGSVLLLLLVWTGVLGRPLTAAVSALYKLLFPVAQGGFSLARMILYR